nr:efflux RND transporter permease subunit [Candidatus Levybacteria bacterium]
DKARDDIKAAVDSVTDLPTDAKTPNVTKLDFESAPIWQFAITTKSDTPSLMRFSKLLQDRIEELAKVDRVDLSGYDDQEVQVILDPEKIASFGLNPTVVATAIQKAAGSYPAGNVETATSAFSLTIDRDINQVSDIRQTRILVEGQSVRLGDIAQVSNISKVNQNQALLSSKNKGISPTVQFFVYRAKTANIDAAEKDVRAVVEKTLHEYDEQFQVTTITNNSEDITKQFSDLTRNFIETIILVFVLLLIFLGLRQAMISSITVPLTFFSTFAIINALGLTLNFLTSFAFLIALGLLIDDTIVTVAAMTRYYATKKFTPAETGILVWRDFIVPLWSTTITTIWAFIPLLLASGIIGEFIKSIPIVVTVTMISSTSIAVLITLPLMIIFLKPTFPKRVKIFFAALGVVALFAAVAYFIPKNPLTPLVMIVFAALIFIAYRIRTNLGFRTQKFIQQHKVTRNIPSFFSRIFDRGLIDIEILSAKYMTLINRILVSKHGKRNTLIAIAIFALCAYLLVPLGVIKNEFFPKSDANVLYVAGELPPGTNLATNKTEMLQVLSKVKNTEYVDYIVGETGTGFSSSTGGRSGSGNSFLLTLHLIDMDSRDVESTQIAEKLRDQLKNYAKGKLTVQEESGGPPAGADVQITLLGDDLTKLDQYANSVMQFLEKQSGVTNIDKSIKPGTSKLVFVLDKDKLVENNLTVDQVSLWLRTYASGYNLDELRFGNEKDKQDVVFRVSSDTQTAADLGRLSIPLLPATAGGEGSSVPLISLGQIKLATNPTTITREKGKRTITVTGSVVAGYNTTEINQNLAKFADGNLNLTEGYTWQTGGANEENEKSIQSILQAMVISFLLILITMVIEFRSFRQTFIALLIIPLSVAGVLYIFALTGTPLGFPSLIGILALFGIVVTHAIVVIEKINDNIHHGMELRHAIVDAAGNRLEPVLLTSAATILGLVPITISDPFWRGLGGAIIAGLLFSGAIKLFFVPVTYYLMFKNDPKIKK